MKRFLMATAAAAISIGSIAPAYAQDHNDQPNVFHQHQGEARPAAAAAPQAAPQHAGPAPQARPQQQGGAPQGGGDHRGPGGGGGDHHWNGGQPGQGRPQGQPQPQQSQGGQPHDRGPGNQQGGQQGGPGGDHHWNGGGGQPGQGRPPQGYRPDFRPDRGQHQGGQYQGNGGRYDRPQVWQAPRRYRAPAYRAPYGFGYRTWSFGQILPGAFFTRQYVLYDFWDYGLPEPPPGLIWVRSGPDALLVEQRTGYIVEVANDLFY